MTVFYLPKQFQTHMDYAVPLGLAFALSAAHFLSEKYAGRLEKWHSQILGLSAGLFLAVLTIDLLPRVLVSKESYYFLFAGLVAYHGLEKYVYQHSLPKDIQQNVGLAHVAGFFFDNFFDGIVIVLVFATAETAALLVFVPLLLHKLSSSLLLSHLTETVHHVKQHRFLLSTSTFLGALTAWQLQIHAAPQQYSSVFSFLLGTLLYLVVRDMIPGGKRGDLGFFIAGAAIGLAAMAFTGG